VCCVEATGTESPEDAGFSKKLETDGCLGSSNTLNMSLRISYLPILEVNFLHSFSPEGTSLTFSFHSKIPREVSESIFCYYN
jgi:hypothetical protein